MDPLLEKYLNSGKAWLLVGSGPSIEMGYPSWEKLATTAAAAASVDSHGADLTKLNAALSHHDYPLVFEESKIILGGSRLLHTLREILVPTRPSKIYELLARWPINVYLTTNYDAELARHLGALGLFYTTYSNSSDHMNQLISGFSGAIVNLHGDLTSEQGLILTRSQYNAITASPQWDYWRVKMSAILQMNPVVVIGHSLSDSNIKHVLQVAKIGAGFEQPVIWIAPNVSLKDRAEYQREFRIWVVSYQDRDGQHRNLVRLIENITDFVIPRTQISVRDRIDKVSCPQPAPNSAAAGFFVFNAACTAQSFAQKRIDVVVSAIESSLPEINDLGHFKLEVALELAGWPKD